MSIFNRLGKYRVLYSIVSNAVIKYGAMIRQFVIKLAWKLLTPNPEIVL